jgi:Arc/MetJ family transcription regulator
MRTNIELDDKLLSEAMHLTGLKTKRAVVDEALRTLLRVRRRKSLLDLRGKLRFAPDFDHKALRQNEK